MKNHDNPGHEAYSPEGEDPNPWDADAKTLIATEAPSFDDVPSPISSEPLGVDDPSISSPAEPASKPPAPKIVRAVRPAAVVPARTLKPAVGGRAPTASRAVAPRTHAPLARAAAQPIAFAPPPPSVEPSSSSRSLRANFTPSHFNTRLTDTDNTLSVSREELLNAVASSDNAGAEDVTVESHPVDPSAQDARFADDVPAAQDPLTTGIFAWGREPARGANVDPLIASSEQFSHDFSYASFGNHAPHSAANDAATRVYPAMQSGFTPSMQAAAPLVPVPKITSSQQASWDGTPSPAVWPQPLPIARDTSMPVWRVSWSLLVLIVVCLAIFIAGIIALVISVR